MNKMEDVAKLLGLELGQSFKIVDDTYGIRQSYYRLTEENGCEISSDNTSWATVSAEVLKWLIMGDVKISKLPWKPTKGEKYYVSHILDRDLWDCYSWNDHEYDEELYKRGVVFKTKEEAIEAAKKMLAAINEQ